MGNEPIDQKEHFVAFPASRFLYAMLGRNLMKAQK